MYISFAKNGNWKELLTTAYTFRCSETPEFTQQDDCIIASVNSDHHEGFDNISLLSNEKYTAGISATLHGAFCGDGCPEIIIVPEKELCSDGVTRYGACFEFLIWKNGINVWRHYKDGNRCHWHLRMSLKKPVAEGTVHELNLKVKKDYVYITLDGQANLLRLEDLPEKFYIGVTACEGLVRLYDFEIQKPDENISVQEHAEGERYI